MPPKRAIRTANDSASQSYCDSPADILCRPSRERPGSLSPLRRCALSSPTAARPCRRVLMSTAPLSSDSILKVYYHAAAGMSTLCVHFTENFVINTRRYRPGRAKICNVAIKLCTITRAALPPEAEITAPAAAPSSQCRRTTLYFL